MSAPRPPDWRPTAIAAFFQPVFDGTSGKHWKAEGGGWVIGA